MPCGRAQRTAGLFRADGVYRRAGAGSCRIAGDLHDAVRRRSSRNREAAGGKRRGAGATRTAAARHPRSIRHIRDPLSGDLRPPMVSPSVAGAARPRIVYFYLAIVVVSWAGNWPIMKLALADAPGPVFVLLRLVGTLALMGPILTTMGAPLLPRRGERLGQFVVGLLQVAGFMIFSILGLSILPAGRAIILAYTMPL